MNVKWEATAFVKSGREWDIMAVYDSCDGPELIRKWVTQPISLACDI